MEQLSKELSDAAPKACENAANAAANGKKQPMTIMKALESLVNIIENSKLKKKIFEKARPYTDYLAGRLELTPAQSILFAAFTEHSWDNNISISEISGFFNCKNIRLLTYSDDLRALEKRRLLRCSRRNGQENYRIPADVMKAIKENRSYTPENLQGVSLERLLIALDELLNEFRRNEVEDCDFEVRLNWLLEVNPQLAFTKALEKATQDFDERVVLIYFCCRCILYNDNSISIRELNELISSRTVFYLISQELAAGTHALQKEYIENAPADGLADLEKYCLTERGRRLLLSEVTISARKNAATGRLVAHNSLPEKRLYYNERESRQVKQLARLLMPEPFAAVQERLAGSGMRRGFACLFYGAPGTGKTETAHQLARQTGRDILPVNVTEVKSMWVGKSENNLQRIFNEYRQLAQDSKLAPILLFNEADALFGLRREKADSAVEKMENSLQNILLQEMERLDGILIATTNLTQNLDKAFERRFLYKIRFDKPSTEAKQAIWQTLLPTLTESETRKLAEEFSLSGGQIENVARKHLVDELLESNGGNDFETLRRHCREEEINHQKTAARIGFH